MTPSAETSEVGYKEVSTTSIWCPFERSPSDWRQTQINKESLLPSTMTPPPWCVVPAQAPMANAVFSGPVLTSWKPAGRYASNRPRVVYDGRRIRATERPIVVQRYTKYCAYMVERRPFEEVRAYRSIIELPDASSISGVQLRVKTGIRRPTHREGPRAEPKLNRHRPAAYPHDV